MSNAQDDSAIPMQQDSEGNGAFQSPNRQIVDGSAAAVALQETTHEQDLPPPIGAPLLSIEFSAQQVAFSLALDENDLGSMGESTEMGNSSEPTSTSPPGTQFRLLPRKPHLIDRSPAVNARGRKRPAQSMNTTHLLRDQAPSSPLTSNLLGLQTLSLHSPRPKNTGPPQSPATSCRSFTVGSPATSFSKVAGSPSRERRSHSIGNAGDRPTERMALSPKIVPLTVLTHSDPSKLTTPPQCSAFMSPPRSAPRQNSSLLQSPFSIGPRGPIVGTPQSSSKTLGDFSFSTPNSTLNDTPLPRISLTPRSTSSRHTRGAVPRFPSPTDLEHRPAPPLPFVVGNPNSSPSFRTGANEPPHVSTENSTSSAAAAATAEVRDPPAIARSLLDCPLDNFLISRSDVCLGNHLETESLSDDDSDDFLLAFPSTIIEEKQQQLNAARQAKQPRINGLSKHVAMASTNSMSVSSLLGMAYATSDSNLHNSMSSLNYGDTIFPNVAGLKREESVASIGLTLDAPMTTTASDGRCDLVTPPPVDASANNLALGPPAIHKSRKGSGVTMLTGDDPSIRHPLSNSGLVSFSLEPKRSPPTFA